MCVERCGASSSQFFFYHPKDAEDTINRDKQTTARILHTHTRTLRHDSQTAIADVMPVRASKTPNADSDAGDVDAMHANNGTMHTMRLCAVVKHAENARNVKGLGGTSTLACPHTYTASEETNALEHAHEYE